MTEHKRLIKLICFAQAAWGRRKLYLYCVRSMHRLRLVLVCVYTSQANATNVRCYHIVVVYSQDRDERLINTHCQHNINMVTGHRELYKDGRTNGSSFGKFILCKVHIVYIIVLKPRQYKNI